MTVSGLVLTALLAGSGQAATGDAAASLVFVLDPRLGMEPGVRTVASVRTLLFAYDGVVDSLLPFDESTALGKAGGIVRRVAQSTLIDIPVRGVMQTLTHEAFGHGTRAKEAGQSPYYEFRLPFPYAALWGVDQGESPGFAHRTFSGQPDRDLATTFGGVESDFVTAHWLNASLVRGDGTLGHGDLLSYATAKLTYVDELSADLSVPAEDGADISAYVDRLTLNFNQTDPAGRARIATRLRAAYAWNFIDPTFWLATYHYVVTYLFHGRKVAALPLFRFGDARLWPGTRFNLSPFGAEHYLELFGRRADSWGSVYVRAGFSGLAQYSGAGIRAVDAFQVGPVRAGAEVDLWWQPQLIFESRYVFEREQRLGASVAAHASFRITDAFSVMAKLAYKTRGYLMGQPLDGGIYGYAGVSIAAR